MTESLFAKLAPQVAEIADIAYLHIMGEALLHPQLQQFAEIACKANLPLGMTTNGTLFEHENTAVLANPVFRQLNISLHSGVTELETVFDFADSLLKQNPEIHINYRLWDVGKFSEERSRIAARYGVSVSETAERQSVQLAQRMSLHTDISFEWPSLDAPFVSDSGFCHGGIRQFGVMYNGDVTACCLDADCVINFGNADQLPLKEILFSRRFEQMRNGFHRRKVIETLCQRCSYRERFL